MAPAPKGAWRNRVASTGQRANVTRSIVLHASKNSTWSLDQSDLLSNCRTAAPQLTTQLPALQTPAMTSGVTPAAEMVTPQGGSPVLGTHLGPLFPSRQSTHLKHSPQGLMAGHCGRATQGIGRFGPVHALLAITVLHMDSCSHPGHTAMQPCAHSLHSNPPSPLTMHLPSPQVPITSHAVAGLAGFATHVNKVVSHVTQSKFCPALRRSAQSELSACRERHRAGRGKAQAACVNGVSWGAVPLRPAQCLDAITLGHSLQ